MQTESLYSISVHLQSGLIRGVGGLWCEWPYSISVHLKSGLIRGVAFERSGLIREELLYIIHIKSCSYNPEI